MKRLLALIPAAAAVVALSMTPALAKSKKHTEYRQGGYEQSYQQYGPHSGWNSRQVFADPSFSNRGAINAARASGRCVEDLGYGRYEFCGW